VTEATLPSLVSCKDPCAHIFAIAPGIHQISCSDFVLGCAFISLPARNLPMYENANSVSPVIVAVASDGKHRFSKQIQSTITLLAGLGVKGDSHCGAAVQHLCDRAKDPSKPNLRQVHLIEQELLEQLRSSGFAVAPGQLGENITTRHIDLLRLEAGTLLQLGSKAVVRITGLREPCVKIARLQKGLQKAVTATRDGHVFMRGAVMGVVAADGDVSPGDPIHIRPSAAAHSKALQPV
jgi:MOSC domain-containing protein YiiM